MGLFSEFYGICQGRHLTMQTVYTCLLHKDKYLSQFFEICSYFNQISTFFFHFPTYYLLAV